MAKFIQKNPYYYKHIPVDESIINKLFVAYESMNLSQINEQLLNIDINLSNKNNENGLHVILSFDDTRYNEDQKFTIIKELIISNKGLDFS